MALLPCLLRHGLQRIIQSQESTAHWPKNTQGSSQWKDLSASNNRMVYQKGVSPFLFPLEAVTLKSRQGEPVSADQPIVQDFSRKIKPGDPRRAFPTNIIVSYADLHMLPYQMTDRMPLTDPGHQKFSANETVQHRTPENFAKSNPTSRPPTRKSSRRKTTVSGTRENATSKSNTKSKS